jgi:tRNA pseudouridine32 synthase/23S rRNA pseudouridine746 synthase/23S rRNA pseudouridine1911/1915/1917 synthase
LAIVQGTPDPSVGSWQSYLYEDDYYHVHSTKDPKKGEKAITHYQVLDAKKDVSLLKLTLETGKKNQIRVHCREAGHPIVGDRKYGSAVNPLRRLGLHAHRLSIKHPITGKQMTFISPVPPEFRSQFRRIDI